MKSVQLSILFILSISLTFISLSAQTYCDLLPADNSSEWITGVQIGGFSETSGSDDGGYFFSSDANIELQKGESYDLELSPGFAADTYDEYWRVWIDYNDDGDFTDNNELVFESGSASNAVVNGSFTVPTNISNSTTRLRVAMKYIGSGDEDLPESCGQFDYGEVEDFSVIISDVTDDPAPYCSANGNSTDSEWIASVEIGSYSHSSGDDDGYANHTDEGIISLQQGSNNSMTLTPGYSGDAYDEYWRIWIDYNADNDFSDAGELVYDAGDGYPNAQSAVLEISNNANLGLTRMRIAMKGLSSTDETAPTNCGAFDYGETEDYQVMITAAIPEAPAAQFSANQTSGDAPLTVNYTNQSTNNPDSYSWTFEGGSPSTSSAENPTVSYNTPGVYNVTLTVSNGGGTDTETKNNYITVNGAGPGLPSAAFSSSTTSGDAPLTVNFFDQSSNNPVSWSWNFQGGNPSTSNSQNPTVQYNTPGVYTVTLTVTNSDGSDTETLQNYITVTQSNVGAPAAQFTANTNSGPAPLTVNFTDNSTNNPTSWSWLFEGGNPGNSNAQNPTVVYNNPGTYQVTLVATNANGSDTETIQNFITVTEENPSVPAAQFTSDITAGPAPLTVNFSDISTNNPTSWSWFFEGGSPASSSIQNPVVVYDTPGTYEVTLVAANAAGSDTETTINYITVTELVEGAPQALFTSDVTTGPAPLVVNFFDQSTNNPSQRAWSFPGGVQLNSDAVNPVVQYEEPGVYDVILTVSNDLGSDTETKVQYIVVTVPEIAPEADFSSSTQAGSSPLTVTFFDQSTNDPTTWFWEFGGGIPNTSEEKNPTVVYQNEGEYQVSLTSSNGAGADTETKSAYIIVGFPASIEEEERKQVSMLVFPNPTEGACQLRLNGFEGDLLNLQLLSVDGKQMLNQHLGAGSQSVLIPLDLSNFPAGVYMLMLSTEEGYALSTRLLVQ